MVTAVIVSSVVADDAETKLKQGREMFYKEIGCTATAGNSYECPDLKTTIKKDKCYYDGQAYDLGRSLENDKGPYQHCQASCTCIQSYNSEFSSFRCAHIDCPEFFGYSLKPGQHCIRQYKSDRCCSTGEICDEEVDKLSRCYFEGKEFYEGQKMYPEGDCSVCMCAKGFDNSTIAGNPHCSQSQCNILAHHNEDLHKGCIPVYYKSVCCPIEFRCRKSFISKTKTY